jgi:hypothetical protein
MSQEAACRVFDPGARVHSVDGRIPTLRGETRSDAKSNA